MSGVPAIVLARQDLGEADRIVRLLTEAHGRVDVVARGARRSRHRYPGALEPGVRLVASWTRGRGELATLGEVEVTRAPHRARDDYGRLVLLGYACEVVLALSEVGLEGAKGYGLLAALLDLLESPEPLDDGALTALRVGFEAKALSFAGLAPRLVRCAVCGEPLSGPSHFEPGAGGGLHPWCGPGAPVDAEALFVIEGLRRLPLAEGRTLPVPSAVAWHLASFVEHHTQRPLRSRALFEEVA